MGWTTPSFELGLHYELNFSFVTASYLLELWHYHSDNNLPTCLSTQNHLCGTACYSRCLHFAMMTHTDSQGQNISTQYGGWLRYMTSCLLWNLHGQPTESAVRAWGQLSWSPAACIHLLLSSLSFSGWTSERASGAADFCSYQGAAVSAEAQRCRTGRCLWRPWQETQLSPGTIRWKCLWTLVWVGSPLAPELHRG